MRYSSNATFLVEAKVDGHGARRHLQAPPRRAAACGTSPRARSANREVAAYELSDALGWDIVPLTILRDGPLGVGAVQRFVDHDPDEHYFTLLDEHEDRFREFAVFDVLVNNTDRKGGHCLHDEANDLIVGIDHGLTFHEDVEAAHGDLGLRRRAAAAPTPPTTCAASSPSSTTARSASGSAALLDPDEIDAVDPPRPGAARPRASRFPTTAPLPPGPSSRSRAAATCAGRCRCRRW